MLSLKHCNLVHGNILYSKIDPGVQICENAIYVPKQNLGDYDLDYSWGLYEANGHNISFASYRRGPHNARVGQSEFFTGAAGDYNSCDDEAYVYVGIMHPHFGHFLLTSLSRFWVFRKNSNLKVKILYHGDQDMEFIYENMPIARAALDAFALKPSDFFRFNKTTKIKQVFVPGPSFEETNFAYDIHSEVCKKIGAAVKHGSDNTPISKPVIFSKARLKVGITSLYNEDEVTNYLEKRGATVVFPETLSLSEQINIFEEAPIIVSYPGSALHTSLLSSKPANIIGFSHTAVILSSQLLIDVLKNNRSNYVYAPGEYISREGSGFQSVFRIDDPIAVAEDLLRLIDRQLGWRSRIRSFFGMDLARTSLDYPGTQSLWP